MSDRGPGRARGQILVLTQSDDVTAQLVIDALEEAGEPVVRVDTSLFPARTVFEAAYGEGELAARLSLPDGQEIDLASVRSIWNRRPGGFSFPDGLSGDSLHFVRAEAQQALVGVLSTCECTWVNHPQRDALARYKPLQLRVAQQAGLAIPDTLITTSPEAVRAFVRRHGGDVIYKRLSPATLYDERGQVTPYYTTRVSDALLDRLDQVRVTPCLFQEHLAKAYELRVTVVDGFVATARVDSQDRPETATDWRGGDLPWTPHALDDDVVARLHAVMRRLGLRFGAFDLVVAPDGRHVFLEVNPAGQWAWFPDEITLPIRDAIARLLADGVADAGARRGQRALAG